MNPSALPLPVSELQELLDTSPFHQLFPMTIAAADELTQTLTIRMAFSPNAERSRGSGQYHGGVIASLIDIAGDFALIWRLGYGVPTINFRTDYLRPAADTALVARATVRRIGRSVGNVDIDVEDEAGRLVAIGRGCYGTRAG